MVPFSNRLAGLAVALATRSIRLCVLFSMWTPLKASYGRPPYHPDELHYLDSPSRTARRTRVRFGETDAMGVANNAIYLQYFEIGRIEHLRAMGHSYAEVHDGGIDMVVVEAGIRYLRPLRFDDELTVESTSPSWAAPPSPSPTG